MSENRRTIEERFYALLPEVYRVRDHAQGQPLRALLAILEHEFQAVRDDTQGLYDDWFIETCKEWVVPYIGDLLGVELMRSIEAEGFTQRGYVANTLSYRRRKGTAAVLEQLAFDVTGWRARAVEYFGRLATTQHLQHLHRRAPVTASLRDANALELADGPFGTECHTPEVRSIALSRGRFNIPNVGLHVWRLRHYPLEQVEARPIGTVAGYYSFDVLGRAGALFNDPRSETDIVHLAEERDVPGRLRRRALHAELKPVIEDGEEPPEDGWFGVQPVLRVFRLDGTTKTEFEPHQLCIDDLDVPSGAAVPRPVDSARVLVDPQSGRLALAADEKPDAVLVDYSYGFSADLGGGPYDRRETVPERIDLDSTTRRFHRGVSKEHTALGDETIHTTLADAVDAWNAAAIQADADGVAIDGVIAVMDSRSYAESLTHDAGHPIVLPGSARLRLVAADWPTEVDDPVAESRKRTEGRLEPSGVRPHIRGDIEVLGTDGSLELDGLLVEGSLRVLAGSLGGLALRHCTLVVGHGGLVVESSSASSETNAELQLELTRSIVDGVTLAGSVSAVTITDCILDRGADEGCSLVGEDVDADVKTSTLLGATRLRSLEGSESLFVGPVEVRVVQAGCLRYSYASADSTTPQRFRCQPDLALAAAKAAATDAGQTLTPSERAAIEDRVRPLLTSTTYGHPAYCQLAHAAADELRTGAEDGSEMGAFHMLQQAHRESNLRVALERYLRFGLDAGIFHAT